MLYREVDSNKLLEYVLSGIASGYAGYTGVYGPGQIEGPPSRGGSFI